VRVFLRSSWPGRGGPSLSVARGQSGPLLELEYYLGEGALQGVPGQEEEVPFSPHLEVSLDLYLNIILVRVFFREFLAGKSRSFSIPIWR